MKLVIGKIWKASIFSIVIISLLVVYQCRQISGNTVEINSIKVRDKISYLDPSGMKKSIFINIKKKYDQDDHENTIVVGRAYLQGKLIETCKLRDTRNSGTLSFEIPYRLEDKELSILIEIRNDHGKIFQTKTVVFDDKRLNSLVAFRYIDKNKLKLQENKSESYSNCHELESDDNKLDLLVYARPVFDYVYHDSVPCQDELIDKISLTMLKGEVEPVTFTIFPLEDLGNSNVQITELKGAHGTIEKNDIEIFHVTTVESRIGVSKGNYQIIPIILTPTPHAKLKKRNSERFWINITSDKNLAPGIYKGSIKIKTESGFKHDIPIEIDIVPITLTNIPGIDYFMLFTYEFLELSRDLEEREKKKVYENAKEILKNYKAHGMTTVSLHSPFVLKKGPNGINVDDIKWALRTSREVGFEGPIFWYMGHLIHTAKGKHPGNYRDFDKDHDLKTLRLLVSEIKQYSKKHGYPEVVFIPIDEPHDTSTEGHEFRWSITSTLVSVIRELGAETMVTSNKYIDGANYICSNEIDPVESSKTKAAGSQYFFYDNDVTTKTHNALLARYRYGYYTWKNNLDGMTSWTFQTTQNARGLPGVIDTEGSEVFLAYPSKDGPIATIKWEAIREGIEDHQLLHQLIVRVEKLNERKEDIRKYTKFIDNLMNENLVPNLFLDDRKISSLNAKFQKRKYDIINLIMESEKLLKR